MTTENWSEERERLVRLLAGIESGKITHVDEEDLRQLQPKNPQNIAALKERLAELNSRLGPKDRARNRASGDERGPKDEV